MKKCLFLTFLAFYIYIIIQLVSARNMNLIAIESSEQENLSHKRIVGVHMSGSHYSGIIIFVSLDSTHTTFIALYHFFIIPHWL